jgi:osmotically-inducible protein OsmY
MTTEISDERPAVQTASRNVELETRVALFLFQNASDGIEGLTIEAQGSTVKVTGRARSKFHRYRCIDCCRRVAGVRHVVDDLHLAPSGLAGAV